jgi:lipopolysaccharide export LptBFGC system permease protein LptF
MANQKEVGRMKLVAMFFSMVMVYFVGFGASINYIRKKACTPSLPIVLGTIFWPAGFFCYGIWKIWHALDDYQYFYS